MKLGSLKSDSFDGDLCIVSHDLKKVANIKHICPNFRSAIEQWDAVSSKLNAINTLLNSGQTLTELLSAEKISDYHPEKMLSALPRTWLFVDGSAFIHHIRLVRKARNAEPPETLMTVPLVYQGEAGRFLSPTENIPQRDISEGTDFEAEVGVITDFVPMGTEAEAALQHILFVVLINDVSLRGLIPAELAQGFGFFQSKPASALSPLALTLDELKDSWQAGRLHLPLHVELNSQTFGQANAGAMHFHFGQLIAHAAKTRDLPAGTIIGSGTVSNEDPTVGSSCLAEKRTIEQIQNGKIETQFLKPGDQIKIFMNNLDGQNLFGDIQQKVVSKSSSPRP
ncbi:MAG: fumarylacetoacetate hydrolase family protein [Pseudobdellovibrionaceae bacterium]